MAKSTPISENQLDRESLSGKRVVISGGTTGIGRATALELARHGANVLICGRHQPEMREALAALREFNPECFGIIADMATKRGVQKFVKEADKRLGGIDILIANAALAARGAESMAYDDIDYVIRTNVTSYLALCHEAILRMKKRKKGHIVLVGSMSADWRNPGSSVYVATKAAVQGFAASLRKDAFEMGIRVTLIEPGLVSTDMAKNKLTHPLKIRQKKMLKADDIASMIHYCLIQPDRCDIVEVSIRPTNQEV